MHAVAGNQTAEGDVSFRARLQAARHVLVDWRPVALVGLCLVLMLLVVQFPFTYTILVGQERGPESDLPFLHNFNGPENSYTEQSFRWTRGQSTIVVPGVGQRDLIVRLPILAHRAQWQPDAPPTVLRVQMGQRAAVPITLRDPAATYHFFVPADAMEQGALRMHLATQHWQGENDQRTELGVAVGRYLTLTGTRMAGLVWPAPGLLLAWPLSLLLFWISLGIMGFARRLGLLLLLPLVGLLPLLALFEAPRLAAGNAWIWQFGLIWVGCAALCAWLVPPLLRRLNVLPTQTALAWLLLLLVLTFAIKYGGRLYPDSMPGDLQLHVNRYTLTAQGRFYIEAQHRGLPFPFPNALYVLIAPLTLPGFSIHALFELTAGLFEVAMVLLLYVLMARVTGNFWMGVLAAAMYALTPAGFMTTWFAFETQVSALFFSALLMTVLVLRWPDYRDWWIWGLLVFLFAHAFLGHIGQFMNTVFLGLLLVPFVWWRYRRPDERRGVRQIVLAALVAGLFAWAFYYSRFTDMFVEQLVGMFDGGLNEITGRQPIPRSATLHALWYDGLVTHFGFFPVLLALPGGIILATRRRYGLLGPLIGFTALVALSQALLPLVTLSSITTRWLLFATWAICVAAAVALAWVWRRGRSGKLVTLAMAGFVFWQTLVVWIDAMALRDPPVEPF